jgi:hypothetical protein
MIAPWNEAGKGFVTVQGRQKTGKNGGGAITNSLKEP